MALESLTHIMRPLVEEELRSVVNDSFSAKCDTLRGMLAYHMGWEGAGAGKEAQGKRIRPLLLLLSTASIAGEWEFSLPAAAAIELVHNFSLIHDDIQDNSDLRRGRKTVWKEWGMPQAINAGDAMFSLASLCLLRLRGKTDDVHILDCLHLLKSTCIKLTEGQYLDISYQERIDITVEDYWTMVAGKTAALLSCTTEMGAILGKTEPDKQNAFRRFGYYLGMAFQAVDDWLGIWGEAAIVGKSNESDLIDGKKSLPVVFGVERKGQFFQRWSAGKILPAEVPSLAKMLEVEGAMEYTENEAKRYTNLALTALEETAPRNIGTDTQVLGTRALHELTALLLKRKF